MLKIALTGGAGSGKSTVAHIFKELGARVLDADQVAREVVAPGQPAWEELRRTFDADFFQADGALNRAKLAHRAFADHQTRETLNAILHPQITRMIKQRLKELADEGVKLVIVEVPLLFETGLEAAYDRVIVVYADTAEQTQRLEARDGRNTEEIAGILAAQWPLKKKRDLADYMVDNRGSFDDTKKQVENIWRDLKNHLDKQDKKG